MENRETACAANGELYDSLRMKLKRQRLVSDGAFARMMQTASEHWKRCDFPACAEVMEKASRLDPGNHNVLLDLGAVYGKTHDYAAAQRSFDRAIRIAPVKSEALTIAGLRCLDFKKHDLAERYLQQTVVQPNGSPDILVKIAEIYERRHRLDEANAYVDRALSKDSKCGPALLARARLLRQNGKLEEAERVLRNMPSTITDDLRAKTQYELGGVLDRQKRYDEAMAAFLEAKRVLQPQAARQISDLKIVRERLNVMKAGISADLLGRWHEAGKSLQPQHRLALLGGHPRSGTTLLEQVLDAHPGIISAEETEIFHDAAYIPLTKKFPADPPILSVLESAQAADLQQSRKNYFRSMELFLGEALGDRLLIDKNPSLTFLIPAMARIFPEMKFIIALRDPRDVCLSCFMQPLSLSQVSAAYLTIQDTVEEYASLMGLWLTLRPLLKNPYLEVKYEDMVNDLPSVAKRTLNFVELPWDASVLRFDEHARNKLVLSPTYADVAKPVFKTAVARWRNYEKYLEPQLERLEPFVQAFGYAPR